jgi:hypothetical protein
MAGTHWLGDLSAIEIIKAAVDQQGDLTVEQGKVDALPQARF